MGPTELEYKINTSIGLTLNFFNDTLPNIFASCYAFGTFFSFFLLFRLLSMSLLLSIHMYNIMYTPLIVLLITLLIYKIAREGIDLLGNWTNIDPLLILHPILMGFVHKFGQLIRTKLIDKKKVCFKLQLI